MSAAHHYKAFGLNIHSDQPIHTLQELRFTAPDVRIVLGKVEDQRVPDHSGFVRREWHASDQAFLLVVKDVARFRVTNGSEIRIDLAAGANDKDVEAYLLGSVFAAVLQQRKRLTLHASAIDTPGGAVLFLGFSGMGKSTLLAAMLARGYAMISDDISAINFNEIGVAMVQPAFPSLRLSQSAIAALGLKSAHLTRMRADKDKFLIPVDRFCETPRPLRQVFLLDAKDQSEIDVQPLSPSDQFRQLTQFTFRKNYYSGHGLEPFHFHAVSTLVRQNLMRQIIRPTQSFEIQKLADRIEQALA